MQDKYEQGVLDDIEAFGWHLIAIEADKEGPGFVYSVGMMHTLNHPEIIMLGLNQSLMARVINDMGDQVRARRRFDELGLFEGLLEGYACKLIAVREVHHREYLGYAMWHRRHTGHVGDLRALQCLWPDREGRFPDEAGCASYLVQRQPLLG